MPEINRQKPRIPPAPPLPNQLAYRIPDACRMAGIGKTKLYALAQENHLRLIRLGGRTLVCGNSLRALLTS